MPLHDHFHPPLSVRRPWEGFHSAWATAIAFHLNNGVLPAEYYAMPLVETAGRVEVDVATLREDGIVEPRSGAATAPWSPPSPTQTLELDRNGADVFEVQIQRQFGGPQLRAALELVSPSNKDRPASRRAFASKCVGYLNRGVSLIVVDIVTERSANLHAEILHALQKNGEPPWESPTKLYVVAYRPHETAEWLRIELWQETLTLGMDLPTVPLWLEPDLCVRLPLEESYRVTAQSLRM